MAELVERVESWDREAVDSDGEEDEEVDDWVMCEKRRVNGVESRECTWYHGGEESANFFVCWVEVGSLGEELFCVLNVENSADS